MSRNLKNNRRRNYRSASVSTSPLVATPPVHAALSAGLAIVTIAVCVGLLLLPATPGYAAASEEENVAHTSSAPDALQTAKDFIDAEDYQAALESLRVTTRKQPDNADAWNLLGYSQRKLGMLPDAATSYQQALSINPDHKGALEYQGELFLMLGDKSAAEANHQKLTRLCPDSCAELQQLDKAIKGGNW